MQQQSPSHKKSVEQDTDKFPSNSTARIAAQAVEMSKKAVIVGGLSDKPSLGPQFHINVDAFLKMHGSIIIHSKHRKLWRVQMKLDRDKKVAMYIGEEDVAQEGPQSCGHCRITGWGNHLVSKKRYVFSIPGSQNWPNLRGFEIAEGFNLSAQVHGNGFGHLLWIERNEVLSGTEILNLWQTLCFYLQVRAISVKDEAAIRRSNDFNIHLRLVQGMAYGGLTWFCRYDYQFTKGIFGVGQAEYEGALDILVAASLNDVYHNLRSQNLKVYIQLRKIVMRCLNARCEKEEALDTLSGVLQFLLDCREFCKKVPTARRVYLSDLNSQNWNPVRISNAVDDVVEILREWKNGHPAVGMSREALRAETVRRRVKTTGLVDHVISKLKNVIVETVQGFFLISWEMKLHKYSVMSIPNPSLLPSLEKVEHDIEFVYRDIVLPSWPANVVLRSVYFMKEFPQYRAKNTLSFTCQIMPPWNGYKEYSKEIADKLPPPIVLALSPQATIFELKKAAEKALRETYIITRNVEVMEVKCEGDSFDDNQLVSTNGFGSKLGLIGGRIDSDPSFRYEGGQYTKVVKCICGTTADDGEDMIRCNVCLTWEHKMCNGVDSTVLVHTCVSCKKG